MVRLAATNAMVDAGLDSLDELTTSLHVRDDVLRSHTADAKFFMASS